MQKSDWLGWACIGLWCLTFVSLVLFLKLQYLVWLSNHTFLILGIALLTKNRWLVYAEFCLGAISELVWSADYLFTIITRKELWGLTTYMFTQSGGFNWVHLYSISHLLFVPAALLGLVLLKGTITRAYLGSFAHMAVLWPLSFLFGSDLNLNCVFYDCKVLPFLPWYQVMWPVVIAMQAVLIYMLVRLVKK